MGHAFSSPKEVVVAVQLRGARGLAKADTFGKSDPYAVLYLDDDELFRTKAISKTLDPDWSEGGAGGVYEVVLPTLDATRGELRVEVHDKDALDSDEFLGGAVLESLALTAGGEVVAAERGDDPPTGRALLSSATEHTLPLQPRSDAKSKKANKYVKGDLLVKLAVFKRPRSNKHPIEIAKREAKKKGGKGGKHGESKGGGGGGRDPHPFPVASFQDFETADVRELVTEFYAADMDFALDVDACTKFVCGVLGKDAVTKREVGAAFRACRVRNDSTRISVLALFCGIILCR